MQHLKSLPKGGCETSLRLTCVKIEDGICMSTKGDEVAEMTEESRNSSSSGSPGDGKSAPEYCFNA